MNKYYWESLKIVLIVAMSFFICVYWLEWGVGYSGILLFIIAGYAIYLNFKALKEERRKNEKILQSGSVNDKSLTGAKMFI